jgi:biotin synthase
MDRAERLSWLRETNEKRLEALWQIADRIRRESVGDAVHLRGLIEISNQCRRHCAYCGLRSTNTAARRYRMTREQILTIARQGVALGFKTIVLQSGEDSRNTPETIESLIRDIKAHADVAVTLSLGEYDYETYARWRKAGADRYLLRFETSDFGLFRSLHRSVGPGEHPRLTRLRWLKELGYEAGGGVMVGLPGQTYESLVDDLEWFAALDLDMIGIGPYIPNPDTPLGQFALSERLLHRDQVPATALMAYKMLALARIMVPLSNIPATTALEALGDGWMEGLQRGANVLMPKLTPPEMAGNYHIYPGWDGAAFEAEARMDNAVKVISALGRSIDETKGCSQVRVDWETRQKLKEHGNEPASD